MTRYDRLTPAHQFAIVMLNTISGPNHVSTMGSRISVSSRGPRCHHTPFLEYSGNEELKFVRGGLSSGRVRLATITSYSTWSGGRRFVTHHGTYRRASMHPCPLPGEIITPRSFWRHKRASVRCRSDPCPSVPAPKRFPLDDAATPKWAAYMRTVVKGYTEPLNYMIGRVLSTLLSYSRGR